MPPRSPRIVIDAHPRGPDRALATVTLRGASVLARLLEQTNGLAAGPVLICAPSEEHPELQALIAEVPATQYAFSAGAAPSDAAVLRTDRLYERSRLRRAVRKGEDPEAAVIWRLDTPHGLAGAEDELERRQFYQPLGRYWALAPARALARALTPTRVRPNTVTLASGGLMLGAAAAVAFAGPGLAVQGAVAVALALALVLDTADGHLARLQGTASAFGRWLDAYLDELADMALHAAIAWGTFARVGNPVWLLLGMLYAMGKYQFVVATSPTDSDRPAREAAGESSTAGAVCEDARSSSAPHRRGARAIESQLASIVRLAGHADVRWHLWIVLAAAGRLDSALLLYAFYFPARALAVAVRKGVRRG